MPKKQKPMCFVIAPIGPNDSDIRRRSDKVLKHIFKKALAHKYDVRRADGIDEPGMITSQVLRAVQECPLVVADLTTHNPNVLYELAVRHAIEKPIIHAIEPKVSKIPFDIAGFRTIEFDLTDPDSIESAVDQLRKQAEQAEKGKWGETPVKLANIMHRSKEDSHDTVLLKEAVEGIASLRSEVSRLSYSIVPPLQAQIDWLTNQATPSITHFWDAAAAARTLSDPNEQSEADVRAGNAVFVAKAFRKPKSAAPSDRSGDRKSDDEQKAK
jgi:hypothetical protein